MSDVIIQPGTLGMGEKLKHFAEYISSKLSPPWGFCLFLFKHNVPATEIMFVSTAQTEGLRKMLRHYLEQLEKQGHA